MKSWIKSWRINRLKFFYLNAQTIEWAKYLASANNEFGFAVALDASGFPVLNFVKDFK